VPNGRKLTTATFSGCDNRCGVAIDTPLSLFKKVMDCRLS